MIFLSIFFSVDPATALTVDYFQRFHMRTMISAESYFSLSRGYTGDRDVCQWRGIVCNENLIQSISWRGETRFHIVSLSWIPSTVKQIEWLVQLVYSTLQTRFLLKPLLSFIVKQGRIYGTIDLRTLPERIVQLVVWHNQLGGTVNLSNLPSSIRVIDLGNNRIDAVVARADSLPLLFVNANFSSTFEYNGYLSARQNRWVEYVSLDGLEMDDRIHVRKREVPAYEVRSLWPFTEDVRNL